MHERGQYGDADYAQISGQLHGYTASNLKDMKAKWHNVMDLLVTVATLSVPRHDTRRPAKKEIVSIYSRSVDGLLLQPLVNQNLLKARLFTLHVQEYLLSRPEMNLKESIGQHEFTSPTSLVHSQW